MTDAWREGAGNRTGRRAQFPHFPSRILQRRRAAARLYLLRCQVRLLVSVQNGFYRFLGRSQDAGRRTKPNAAQQGVDIKPEFMDELSLLQRQAEPITGEGLFLDLAAS